MSNHDDELLAFTVASVWREERVSCPHPDLIQAYETKSLAAGAMEFMAFHLTESSCPYCNSILEDLRSRQKDADETRMSDLKDRMFRSTVSELRRASGQ